MKVEAKPQDAKLLYFEKPTDLKSIKSGIVINGGFFMEIKQYL